MLSNKASPSPRPSSATGTHRHQRYAHWIWWMLLIPLVPALLSCRPTVTPAATPTATRTPILPTATLTPIPTSTSTATPTNTPTPTPTLPPGLLLTPIATRADNCPVTTADLFFLREGRIWVCLAEGGPPEQLPVSEELEEAAVVRYDVTQDRRYVAYVTSTGDIWVLDRALWQQTRLPTSGRVLNEDQAYFAFSNDGGTLTYLSWGVQVGSGPALEPQGSGVMLSLDVLTPTLRQQELATCRASVSRMCQGFLVAPDGQQLAFVDGQGVWLLALPAGEPARLLATSPAVEVRLHSWSPDSTWLVLETLQGATEGNLPAYTLLSTTADKVLIPSPQPLCSTSCEEELVWATSVEGVRLWLAWDDGTLGCVGSIAPDVDGATMQLTIPENRICEAQSLALHPSSPLAGPSAAELGGLVTFYQRAGPGIAAGIYALTWQAELRGVALLPDTQGRVAWSPDGEAFLYTEQGGEATHLGSMRYGVLWDVRDVFAGADAFSWRSINPD